VDFWTFTVKGDDASVRPGPAADPAVLFRCTLADFVRMVAGVVEPLEALFDRTLIIEGDLMVGARVREMFGGVAALGAMEAVET
jgi:putative sterol carrier protein